MKAHLITVGVIVLMAVLIPLMGKFPMFAAFVFAALAMTVLYIIVYIFVSFLCGKDFS